MLNFNHSEAVLLTDNLNTSYKRNKSQKVITYVLRKKLVVAAHPHIFWSPFEVVDLILSVTVMSVSFTMGNKSITIKFNLMDFPNTFLKLSYS